ncbi:MAG: zinc metalloprotease HtpX [candidate division WOR-3 bacterium]
MNYRIKTVLFLGFLTGILIFLGNLLGGYTGMIYALILAGIMNFVSYYFSDKIVLTMYGAKKIRYEEAPFLHEIVEELASRAGIKKPEIYLIPMIQPNAFATGRGPEKSCVAVTQGLLQILTKEEIKGVLAHEIAHIKNRDVLIASIAATIAGAISIIIHWIRWGLMFGFNSKDREENNPLSFIGALILLIFTPIITMLIQLAISRSREYMADEYGAKLSLNPLYLAKALEKISKGIKIAPADIYEGTHHLFIENPLKGETLFELFSTHPPVEKRIKKLYEMAKSM